MVRVAVDAMGGDYAPGAIIRGGLDAIKKFEVSLLFVCQSDRIQA